MAQGNTGLARHPMAVPLGAALGILGLTLTPRVGHAPALLAAFCAAVAGLSVWLLFLWVGSRRSRRKLRIARHVVTPHWVQALVQLSLFGYWGWYWGEVRDHALLILAQVLFAYAFDALLSWSRRDTWWLGFGPLPVVFSVNLFLWFRDDWFWLQFVMVGVGFLGKELVVWHKDGRRAHVFNPAAFSLSLFSFGLLMTGTSQLTFGDEIATTFALPANVYFVVFALGLVVQSLFAVTLTTLGAVSALWALGFAYTQLTGVYWFFDSNLPIAIFIGAHLLVTDPATSPRTNGGRLLFGVLYGVLVFLTKGLLEQLGAPSFYDKLLCIPLLNLAVQGIDRLAVVTGVGSARSGRGPVPIVVWAATFATMVATGFLPREHEGKSRAFWRGACEQQLRNGCGRLLWMLDTGCKRGDAEACFDLGVVLWERRLVPPNGVLAARSFGWACARGHDEACLAAAAQYLRDGVRELDGALLMVDVEAICEAGDAEACGLLRLGAEAGVVPARNDTGRGAP